MRPMLNRRTVLQGAIGALTAAVARPAFAKVGAITAELSLLGGFGGNVVALKTSEGAVLVDSGGRNAGQPPARAHTRSDWQRARPHAVQHALASRPDRRQRNARPRRRQHRRAREDTPAPRDAVLLARTRRAIKRRCRSKAQPTESFYTTGSTTIGGRRIEYGYLIEAHTDGDAYVYFRDDNVIAVGDALAPERDVELDWWGGGWLGGRVDSLKQLLELTNAQTRFVPSYGAPVGRAAVQAEHDMCQLLFDRFFDRIRKGETDRRHARGGHHGRHGPDVERPGQVRARRAQGLLGPQQHSVARHRMKHLTLALARSPLPALRRTHNVRSRI